MGPSEIMNDEFVMIHENVDTLIPVKIEGQETI